MTYDDIVDDNWLPWQIVILFQLRFRAFPNKGFGSFSPVPGSDMAIDDVKFVDCSTTTIFKDTSKLIRFSACIFWKSRVWYMTCFLTLRLKGHFVDLHKCLS